MIKKFKIPFYSAFAINIFLILLVGFYLNWIYSDLPNQIPFFYTMPWGLQQLASKSYICGLFAIPIALLILNIIMSVVEYSKNNFVLSKFYSYISLLINIPILFYAFRIVNIVSYKIIDVPVWAKIIAFPVMIAFITTAITGPIVIKLAKKYGFMDDPLIHKHPGMLLTKPTPRAGGLTYFLGILIPALFILPIAQSQKLIGIFLGAAICVFIGLKDDKKDVNPYVRLFLQLLATGLVVLAGTILIYIPNPFGNSIKLDDFKFVIEFMGTHKIHYISVIVAGIWIMWTMNFMSFANGTDGVYAGLVTITSLVIAILMIPNLGVDPGTDKFIKLAALSAGAGLGMALFTWPPQKILWGFGATSAGLIIAALSIIGSTKVAATLLILLIPFLDGVFAVIRRIRRKQMPFWGDREHLHHKLLEGLGWSKKKVAIFYWLTTILFASIGIASSGQSRALFLASIGAIVIFGITMLNFFKNPRK